MNRRVPALARPKNAPSHLPVAAGGTSAGTTCSSAAAARGFSVAAAFQAAALRFLVFAAFVPAAFSFRVLAAFLPATINFRVRTAFFVFKLRFVGMGIPSRLAISRIALITVVVSMGRRNTHGKSYLQVFQWLNSFASVNSRKTLPCLCLIEYSLKDRVLLKNTIGSTN
jgi:hypothetical protein